MNAAAPGSEAIDTPLGPGIAAQRRHRLYSRALLSVILLSLLLSTARYLELIDGIAPGGLVDFDSFYIAARLAVSDQIALAYDLRAFGRLQYLLDRSTVFYMPWAYPPQYDVLIAPLAFVPRGVAYFAFVAATLAALLVVLRRLARPYYAVPLVAIYIPVLVNINTGQNGFLLATLAGLTGLLLLRRSGWAGVPLGLMIVKPHLAVALGLWVLLDRQWPAAAVATLTIIVASAIATALFGPGVWPAFAHGVAEASANMAQGVYPFYRMVSLYAAARTFGADAQVAGLIQVVAAAGALVVTAVAQRRLGRRDSLGVAVLATLLISPYAYDYDLPMIAVGIALLWPSLRDRASALDLAILAALATCGGAYGLVQSYRLPALAPGDVPTLAGPCLVIGFALVARLLVRPGVPLAAPPPLPT